VWRVADTRLGAIRPVTQHARIVFLWRYACPVMDRLALHLAMHGVAVLTVSVVAGLVLWRVLYQRGDGSD